MTKVDNTQLSLNFENFEDVGEASFSTSTESSLVVVDYSFEDRLAERKSVQHNEIYKEIRSMVEHLF